MEHHTYTKEEIMGMIDGSVPIPRNRSRFGTNTILRALEPVADNPAPTARPAFATGCEEVLKGGIGTLGVAVFAVLLVAALALSPYILAMASIYLAGLSVYRKAVHPNLWYTVAFCVIAFVLALADVPMDTSPY